MEITKPRGGIERKILASILWIGILPLSFVLATGYFFVRDWQRQLAEDSLCTAVEKTCTGIRIAASAYLSGVGQLAGAPAIRDALLRRAKGVDIPDDGTSESLQSLFDTLSGTPFEDSSRAVALFDDAGRLVACSTNLARENIERFEWKDNFATPRFIDLVHIPGTGQFIAESVAPVFAEDKDVRLGCVVEFVDVQNLVRYALGLGIEAANAHFSDDVYQAIYMSGGQFRAASFKTRPEDDAPRLVHEEADPELAAALRTSKDSRPKNLRLARYRTQGNEHRVFLAYSALFEDIPSFLVMYRLEADVFRNVNRGALGMLCISALVIGVLYLNAYRNVHNNIVRNVLLLNEGAQIIGQGDLDLKLKITTGDEIEELAQSFNKMAQALKKNIGHLEASEEKYRSLFTSMRDGVIQVDPQSIVVLVNPAGAEILGCQKAEEPLGRPLQELFDESSQLDSAIQELRERGFLERARIWVTRRDGRRICLEFSGNTLHDDADKPVGFEGVFRDITKNVHLEYEARERAERISATNQIANVINSSLQAGRLYESLVVEVKRLVDFDAASISLLNEGGDAFEMRRLWPEQEDARKETCAATDEAWCAPIVARTQRFLAVDDFRESTQPALRDFPNDIRSCLCVPLHASGRILGTFNLGARKPGAFSKHDIEVMEHIAPHVAVAIRNAQLLENLQESLDEVTRAQEKLREAHEELKTLDEMKTNLLSNVSHELRTPLVAVLGYTDMIYNGKAGPITDKQREYLGIGLRNIEKLVTLIENLLDFSRLHRGSETLVFDTFDLRDCVRSSIEIMRPVAESREITLDIRAPEEPVLVRGDKGKLAQVFTNLLSNAVKFNHHGGAVTVSLQPLGDEVEVNVTDTGIGIPPEAQEKIFTRFYQYDGSSTRKYGGAGIGLSIAQDIARLHGSKIALTSEVGKGSTFSIRLPLRRQQKGGKEGEDETGRVIETRLLLEVVSPDRSFCNQVRALVDGEGMDVIVAADADHAAAIAQRYDPDCFIVDMESAGVSDNGWDAFLPAGAGVGFPVVVFTSDEALYARHASKTSARIKPGFRKSTLLSAIHYVLGYGGDRGGEYGNRILCVDDDPEVVDFISQCLEGEGFLVDRCGSGHEALERVSTGDYGIVLLDIAMPGVDGFETCRRMRANPRLAGLKIYMVTAKPLETMMSQVQEVGFDGCLWKPFKSKDLLDLVRGVVAGHPSSDSRVAG